jgi:Fibronectin type III domain/Beta-propeller repeat
MRAVAIAVAVGAVLAMSASASAQSPQVFRTDGGGRDTASAIATDRDGNSYIAASSQSAASGNTFAVVKLGPDGTRRFIARYDGSQGGVGGGAVAVAVDAAGNVYAAGSIHDGVIFGQNHDYLVVKFAADGTQRWARRYDGPAHVTDQARALAVDGAGNVYVTGSSQDRGTDWATLKFSPDGALQWERRVSGADASDDFPADIALLPDGNVVVTGVTQNRGDRFTNDAETLVYDAQGTIVWRARFSDTAISHEVVFNLDVDAAGRIAIAVTSAPTASPETGEETPVTLRYDSRGVPLQTIRAGGYSVDVDPAGNLYVAGSFFEPSFASVAKYDAAGNRVWATPLTAGANQFLVFPRVAADSTGAVTVAGTAHPLSSGDDDYLTIRFAADGRELSRHRFDGGGTFTSRDEVAGLAIGAGDAALVTGTSFTDSASSPDIVTLRFGAGATPSPAAPAAPSQLEAAAITRREIRLRWRDNAGDEDGFRIERCVGSNCTTFAQVAAVGPNTTSFVDSGLARNTTYRYRVRAFNAAGASAFSNTASARTSR